MHNLQEARGFNKVLCRNLEHINMKVHKILCIGHTIKGKLTVYINVNEESLVHPEGNMSIFIMECEVKKDLLLGDPILEDQVQSSEDKHESVNKCDKSVNERVMLNIYVLVFADKLKEFNRIINKLNHSGCFGSFLDVFHSKGERKTVKVSDIGKICSVRFAELKNDGIYTCSNLGRDLFDFMELCDVNYVCGNGNPSSVLSESNLLLSERCFNELMRS